MSEQEQTAFDPNAKENWGRYESDFDDDGFVKNPSDPSVEVNGVAEEHEGTSDTRWDAEKAEAIGRAVVASGKPDTDSILADIAKQETRLSQERQPKSRTTHVSYNRHAAADDDAVIKQRGDLLERDMKRYEEYKRENPSSDVSFASFRPNYGTDELRGLDHNEFNEPSRYDQAIKHLSWQGPSERDSADVEIEHIVTGELPRLREKLKQGVDQQSDYYAQLYEVNPDVFATMPTKEFMEKRKAFADLEGEYSRQFNLASESRQFADLLKKVVRDIQDDGQGERAGYFGIWADSNFLRGTLLDYQMRNMFEDGSSATLRDMFSYHSPGYAPDRAFRDDIEYDLGEGTLSAEAPEVELMKAADQYFTDYDSKWLDTTPRQAIEGLSAVFATFGDERQPKADEAARRVEEFKAQFAVKNNDEAGPSDPGSQAEENN